MGAGEIERGGFKAALYEALQGTFLLLLLPAALATACSPPEEGAVEDGALGVLVGGVGGPGAAAGARRAVLPRE
jgi:hypothetical protein